MASSMLANGALAPDRPGPAMRPDRPPADGSVSSPPEAAHPHDDVRGPVGVGREERAPQERTFRIPLLRHGGPPGGQYDIEVRAAAARFQGPGAVGRGQGVDAVPTVASARSGHSSPA
ncbi:hypothetical protein [Streptomyces sp. NPDC006368]|uniref:hypothetical protein n=1 Tax=Streptomyces sp. NPDC006368 TaxID=3156760 RepID=UPI0033ACEEAA